MLSETSQSEKDKYHMTLLMQNLMNQDGDIGRNPLLPRPTKRRITTNLKSINNQKRQKIKLHGTLTTKIKEKINQNNQTSKAADHAGQASSEKPRRGSRPGQQGWLKAKLSFCGLQSGLPRWEKLLVSHKSPLESVLETSRQAALFPLWPLPNKQPRKATRRVALPW